MDQDIQSIIEVVLAAVSSTILNWTLVTGCFQQWIKTHLCLASCDPFRMKKSFYYKKLSQAFKYGI